MWRNTLVAVSLIVLAVVSIPVGFILWEGRHFDCYAPEGDCARGGK